MDTVRYTGINHLAMVTNDMDATIRFWRDFLGMRLVAGLGTDRYRHYFFEISAQDMIAFFEWPDVENIPEKDHGVPVKGPFAFDHVSIGVESDKELRELKDRFENADMWVSEIIDHGFIHSIYAFDPNNIPIEFSAPVPGVDVRSKPRMMDRHPSIVAREGSDPVSERWPSSTKQRDHRVYPGEGRVFVDADDDDR
jgi:catechol 2,3-dioxygenase-like lactoylglutathione lyase family enzyme